MVSFKDVIDRVRSVFKRERKQIEQAIELQKGVSQPMGFDVFSVYGRYGMEPLMDYLRVEQELITRFLDYAEMESVSGDTRVMTVWGEMTVLEILDRCNRDPKFIPFVFSYDREKKELVVAPALKPAKTGENKPMFRITFNNGRSLKVTGDHLVMMRDASYRPVKELKVGDRLMPFYSDVSSDGYVRVRQPDQKDPAGNNKKTFVHRMVAECLLRRKLRSDEDVDHYPDHTRTNNDPSNLVVRSDYEHHARHGLVFRVKNTPECARRKKISRTLKKKVWTDNYTLRMAIKHIQNDGIPFDEWIKERRGGGGCKDPGLLPESHRDAIARGRAKKFDALLTKERVIETLEKCASVNEAATLLGVWWGVLDRRIRQYGIDRKEVLGRKLLVTGGNGNNHRVIKIEPCGSEPTYDIPVPKYHNFVAETVVIHNSYPELSAALDIWADEACITADTEIPMLDGSVKTVGELYAAGAKKKWVYGFDPVRARVVAAQFDRVEKIADQCKILKITYQDKFGKVGYLKVTPDHKFLLVNGKYVRSGELNVGDKLMGLIKFQFKDEGRHQWYENVLVRPFAKQWQSTHRMVLDSVGVHVPNGWHVHHEDLNGLNNDPSNLKPLSHEDHLKKHDVRGEKNPRFRHDITWESVDKVLKKTGFISAKELGCILGCGARVILRIAKQRGYKNWSDLKDSLFGLKKNSYGRDHRPETRARYEVLLSQVLEYARVNPLAPFAVFRERFGSAVEEMLKFFNYSGWNDFRKKHNLPILKKTESVLADNAANHTVISIEELPPEDVYDLVNSLPTHNFAAGNGGTWVFVKNTQPDILTGRTVWVESDDVQVKKLLQDLIDTNLEIDEEIWSIARGLCKYGNHFEEILPTQEGVIGINALPPETVRRYERSKGLLVGYAQDPRGVFGITVDDIDQIIQGKQAPPPGMNIFEPWQMVHFRLIGRTRPSVYGVGVLEAARWIWRRLLLLEDAALIYRLCLRGDSKIWTPNGYTLIRDLKPGDEVYCYTRSGKLKKTQVTYHKHNGKDQIYRVRSRHHDIYANATHPILVKSVDRKTGAEVYEYVEVRNLKPSKYRHRFVVTTKPADDWEEIRLRKPEPEVSIKLEKALDARESVWKTEKRCALRAASVSGFLGGDAALGQEKAIAVLEANGYDPGKVQSVREEWYSRDYEVDLPDVADESFARLFGFMLADGFVVNLGEKYDSWRVGFSAGGDEETNARYKALLERYIRPLKFEHVKGSGKEQVGYFYANCNKFAEFLHLNGFVGGSDRKRVPEWVYRAKPTIRRAFLEGFADGDGHEDSTGRTTIELCNKALTEDLRQLCLQLGIQCSRVYYRKPRVAYYKGRAIRSKGSHYIHVYFNKQTKKSERILSIERIGRDDIYDIGVEAEEHNFIVDGLPVHNTRTPTRWVFYIDVGKLPPNQALGHIRRIKNEFTKQKFLSEKGSVDLRYNALSCLTLDTGIPLLDGRTLPLRDIIREHEEGKEHWVYSFNPDTKEIVPGRVTQAAVTRRNAELVEVEIDNGKKVRCTPDHRFYLRDGTQVEAQNLKPGDSLAPLYRYYWPKGQRTQHEVVQHLDKEMNLEATHWMVARNVLGLVRTPGWEVDHINNNPLDNSPGNLQHLTKEDHRRKHAAQGRENITRYNKSDKHRRMVSEINRRERRWEKAKAHINWDKQKKAAAKALFETVTKAWKDPEFRARKSEQVRVMWNKWWDAYRDWKKFNPNKTPKDFRKVFGAPGKKFVYLNHRVVEVRRLEVREDTGCISVDKWHNFAISSYVFVANSDENLFIPVVDGKRTTEVDLMATPEWQVMDDLNYFRDKLFSAIKIPKAYLGYEEASRARLLSLEDVRFARSIMRVQRELRNGLRKICKVHLAALGIDPEKVNFDVFMTVPSWAYELAQLEVRNAKAEFADRVRSYLSERAIMKAIFGFSDDEIDAIRRERAEEDSGGGAPPGGDQRVRRKKAEGNSVLDLPGLSRISKDEDNQIKAINEHLAEISKTNKYIAQKIEDLKDYGRDLRSSMFFKSGNGKTRLVVSQGKGT